MERVWKFSYDKYGIQEPFGEHTVAWFKISFNNFLHIITSYNKSYR